MQKIYYQTPQTEQQKKFIENLLVFLPIESQLEFNGKYKDTIIIVTDKSKLGFKSLKNIEYGNVISIENLPRLSTVGLYKAGQYKEEYKTKYLYLSEYPLNGRSRIIDELTKLMFDGLRIAGPYTINMPNYIGHTSYENAMSLAKSAEYCVDPDGDLFFEYKLNDCSFKKKEAQDSNWSKSDIINTLSYISRFMMDVRYVDSDIYKKCEEFLSEQTRDICG